MKMENEIKKNKFWTVVFRKTGMVCRNEIAEESGLNMRTVVSYAESYKKKGILTEKAIPDGKGRPAIYYQSHLNQVLFLGISMVYEKVGFVLMDINRHIIEGKTIQMDKLHKSSSEYAGHIMNCINEILAMHPDKKLLSAGFCLNEYKQDQKLAKSFKKVFSEFRKKYDIPVMFANPDTTALDRIKYAFKLSGNLAMVHLSDKIRMGLILNEQIVSDTSEWEEKISHFTVVEKNGLECDCGRRGCLCSYLTHSAIANRYVERTGYKKNFDIHSFRLLLEEEDPLCLEMARENGEMLGKALSHLSSELNFSRIYLFTADTVTSAASIKSFNKHCRNCKTVIEPYWYQVSDIYTGIAEMYINEIFNVGK